MTACMHETGCQNIDRCRDVGLCVLALEADGEKLRHLTGEDRGPWFFNGTDPEQAAWQDALDAFAQKHLPEEVAGVVSSWSDYIASFIVDRLSKLGVPETFQDRKDFSKSGKEIPKPTTEGAQSGNVSCIVPPQERGDA